MTMSKEEEDPVAAAAEIKRSQSSLELLSNTAAWKNVVENQAVGQTLGVQESSSASSARVSPAEQTLKTSSFPSSGDFRKDSNIGMSFDEAAYSPTHHVVASQVAVDHHNNPPGLPLMNNNNTGSSASLISSTSGDNLHATLPTFTASSSWQQQLNPNMHAAFTPPRSNLRASSRPLGEAIFGGSTRSLQDHRTDDHHHHHHPSGTSLGASSRQGSSDEGEWSFAASMDSSGIPAVESTAKSQVEALREENEILKAKLKEKDRLIDHLSQQRDDLQCRVDELRQLPTGKISQIPIEDMLELMRTYGSELSDTVMPPRKTKIQKASVIRQFRRWNPNFLEYFQYANGKWIPKLGREGELKRRDEARKQRRLAPDGSSPTNLSLNNLAPHPPTTNKNKRASQMAAV